jgi:hypothetical protein
MLSLAGVSCSSAVFTAFSRKLHSTHPLLHCSEPRHCRVRPRGIAQVHPTCLKGKDHVDPLSHRPCPAVRPLSIRACQHQPARRAHAPRHRHQPRRTCDLRVAQQRAPAISLNDRFRTPLKQGRPAFPRAFACWTGTKRQCLISGGSLPPLAANLVITCLCSQMFMLAESLLSPV